MSFSRNNLYTLPINKKISYHDPCEIGRYRDIYNPARKIFEALPGVEFVEMGRNKEDAFCCGGGGAVKTMFEDHSDTVAKERIQEFSATGADLMTTICPACELNLTQGTYMAKIEARVLDVAELMAVAAGIADKEILDADYFPED